ncbi:MAG: hypothetical protein ACLR4A_04965 [Christensenellales bacterium]
MVALRCFFRRKKRWSCFHRRGIAEALIAAIACGADAVYLGYTAFGARSYAGNFDADGLHEAVEYAHERGKKSM